jgi:hypothetical protein
MAMRSATVCFPSRMSFQLSARLVRLNCEEKVEGLLEDYSRLEPRCLVSSANEYGGVGAYTCFRMIELHSSSQSSLGEKAGL